MSEKLFAGYAMRRLRRRLALTQQAMATQLDISPSYLTLIERNQRPLTAQLLLRLAEQFDIDPRLIGRDDPAGGMDGLRRRLADPMFLDLGIDRTEIEDWFAAAPQGVAAFARLYDQMTTGPRRDRTTTEDDVVATVRTEIERWRNHYPDLDAVAEALSDDLRLQSSDLYAALNERLRTRHHLAVRVLPYDVLPGTLRRLDLHARQAQLSELLSAEARCFQLAVILGQLETRDQIEALVTAGGFANKNATRLYRRHLHHYFAAALMMPYGRFLRACEQTGYDFAVLQRRFGVSFEQLAHRLTTMQRVGARGIAFFMLRIDRTGQVSKRYAGATNTPLLSGSALCPLWRITQAFAQPGALVVDRVTVDDHDHRLSFAMATAKPRSASQADAQFAVVLGARESECGVITPSLLADLPVSRPVGLGCMACDRKGCSQRSHPPQHRPLILDDREHSIGAYDFRAD